MTTTELKLVREALMQGRNTGSDYIRALFILNREIKLKELDPRKESSK